MTVNGTGITEYNAKFWGISKGRIAITNATEAMDESRIPVMMRPSVGLREYTITIHVYGKSRMEQWEKAGRIAALFTGAVSEVRVPGFPGRKFMLTLTGISESGHGGITNDKWYVLALDCAGYECADRETRIRIDRFSHISGDADAVKDVYEYEAQAQALCELPPEAVEVDVTIEQTRAFDGGYEQNFPDFAGKQMPMDADIRIYGLCIGRNGKDMGPLVIWARPDDMKPGGGLEKLKIYGRSGRTEEYANGEGAGYGLDCKIPSPVSFGHKGRKIRIEIDAYRSISVACKYAVSLGFTPIYL